MSHYYEQRCPVHGEWSMDVDNAGPCPYCEIDKKNFAIKNEVRIFPDGDTWCAVTSKFINLQESKAGFGSTPDAALYALVKESNGFNPETGE